MSPIPRPFFFAWLFVVVAIPAALGAEAEIPTCTSKLPLPESVTLATLSNGLTVIVQENHVAPVATVRCFVKNTGSAYEGKYMGAGISHVLEHVVAAGTTLHRTEREIEKIVDGFGGATNAFTSNDMTAYFIDCPAENTMTAIELLADAMQHIKFEPAEFERELKVVRRELADGEVNRERVLWKMLGETVYSTHPARCPVIGYLDVLNATTNEAIIDFYKHRYVPNNQVFVVVGDVDTQKVLDAVAQQYTGTPRSYETYVPFEDEPEQLAPREAFREMEGRTYDLAFAWPTVKLSNPDLYALDVAAYILGQGESSRLVERLKYEEQTVLSVGSFSDTPHYVNGMMIVIAASRPETWQKAGEGILREVYRLRDDLVTPAELAKAKKQKAAELIFGRQTVKQSADGLGRNFITTADPLYDKTYVDGIEKVTAEQIRDVARRYFLPERLNRIVIAPPGGQAKAAEESAKGVEGEIRSLRLSNGLRVLIKRHSQLPLVNVQAFALSGSLADNDQTAGRASLVGSMLDMGTADHTAQQIADYFDSIGGQLSMNAGRFTIYGGATTLRDDFPNAMALFAECFCRPTFPDDEFAKMKQLALGAIAQRAGNPQQQISEFFSDNLPTSSPYHIIQGGKKETVEKLTADDLRKFHQQYFVPENMIVTVFGDIDPDAAQQLVEKYFGEKKPNAAAPKLSFDRDNTIPQTIDRHLKIGMPTAMVIFGYPTASIFQKEDFAAMTVLGTIMGGYHYPGGWLHNELRGEGLVYSVHAMQMTGPVPGYFDIIAQTEPKKLDEVVKRIEKNVERAKQGRIDDEEFQTAVQRVIAYNAQENTTIGEQAMQAALDEFYGLGYDYHKSFDARIKAVTLKEVVEVANKYLGNHVLVTSSPEKE